MLIEVKTNHHFVLFRNNVALGRNAPLPTVHRLLLPVHGAIDIYAQCAGQRLEHNGLPSIHGLRHDNHLDHQPAAALLSRVKDEEITPENRANWFSLRLIRIALFLECTYREST